MKMPEVCCKRRARKLLTYSLTVSQPSLLLLLHVL